MTLSVEFKEKPAVKPPETSAAVTGTTTTEAPQLLKKGHWTAAEDAILERYVEKYGKGNWNAVQKNLGLQRCGKSCRLRWANHLRPNLKKGAFSPEEEALIVQLHAQLGNKWALMALQLPGRTDNEIKNYWNTRIKRRQRVGLPLYPPEIQYQTALKNQKQGTLMLSQNQTQPKNFISHISPTTTTLFSNNSTGNNNANYLLRNFNLNSLPQPQPQSQPQQLPSPTFSTNMKLPSTQLFSSCAEDQKLPPLPTPSIMSQGNNVLFDDLYQKSQGPEELFDEGLFFEPLSTSCITTAEPLTPSPQPSPTSIFNHSVVEPLYKLENSDISIGTQVMKQPDETMINKVASNQAKINMTHTTVMPTEKLLRDWCELCPSIGVTEDDLRFEMQQLASTLSTTYDWNFESNSLENMHNIY